jgi:hypothetical protein
VLAHAPRHLRSWLIFNVGQRKMNQVFVPLLAEVGDKVPRLWVLGLWCAGITLLAWLLTRKRKWLVIIPLPLAAVFAVGVTHEPRDPFVGPAIIRELGYSYVTLCYLFAIAPFAMIAVLIIRSKKEPNQSPQHNAGSRPSSGDSPACETPSSSGPRG